jgi:hypothetical protein
VKRRYAQPEVGHQHRNFGVRRLSRRHDVGRLQRCAGSRQTGGQAISRSAPASLGAITPPAEQQSRAAARARGITRSADGFFGGPGNALDLNAVGRGVAAGAHLFVRTYLLGVTVFAAAGESRFARYAPQSSPGSSPSTACSESFWRLQARPTISDSRCSICRRSARSRRPPRALDSASGDRARPRAASTSYRARRCGRVSPHADLGRSQHP